MEVHPAVEIVERGFSTQAVKGWEKIFFARFGIPPKGLRLLPAGNNAPEGSAPIPGKTGKPLFSGSFMER